MMKKLLSLFLSLAFCTTQAADLVLPDGSVMSLDPKATVVFVELLEGPPPSIRVVETTVTRLNGVRTEARVERPVACDPLRCLAQRIELAGRLRAALSAK